MTSGNGFSKNVIISGVDNISSFQANNKKTKSLIFGKCPSNGLDDTTIGALTECSINFRKSKKIYFV